MDRVQEGSQENTVPKAPAACLIGWPAAHSRSPLIHHYWLRKLGIEGGYNIEHLGVNTVNVLEGFLGA